MSTSRLQGAARLKVAALISGPPHAQELWTLRAMNSVDCDLTVVPARQATTSPASKRIRRLIKDYGVLQTASRFPTEITPRSSRSVSCTAAFKR